MQPRLAFETPIPRSADSRLVCEISREPSESVTHELDRGLPIPTLSDFADSVPNFSRESLRIIIKDSLNRLETSIIDTSFLSLIIISAGNTRQFILPQRAMSQPRTLLAEPIYVPDKVTFPHVFIPCCLPIERADPAEMDYRWQNRNPEPRCSS